MKTARVVLGILFSVLLFGCTTPSKSSRIESLVGDGTKGVTEAEILKDIARTVYVMKKNVDGAFESGKVQTSTWVKIYPYTRPLLIARVRKNIAETAFKERWSDEKRAEEFRKTVDAEEKRLILDRQCFAVEINTRRSAALELKYWYGTLKQNDKEQSLSFSKGQGFTVVEKTTVFSGAYGVYSGTTTESREHFFYADACGTTPIQLADAFSISIDPRYELGLAPIELSWLAPKK